MKYFSAFSGIGGFELGIGKNAKCIGYSEIDKYAIKIYQSQFPKHKNYGDITKIKAKELPDFDLFVGGFPCQSFSVAGKRRGFEDTRGTLFFDIARILKEKKPKHFLLENVKGLLSHDSGRTFKTIISTLAKLGYRVEWQVLNSKNFGVPQNRERVFIIGYLGKRRRAKILPIRSTGEIHPRTGSPEKKIRDIASTLTARQFSNWNGNYIKEITHKQSQGMRVYRPDGISSTIASQAGGMGAKTGLYAIPVLTPDRKIKRQNGRRMKGNNDPAFTITANDRHGVYNGLGIRRLTPIECERLQGFPDNWTAGASDTARYKCLGNAVTVNVVSEVMLRIVLANKGRNQNNPE